MNTKCPISITCPGPQPGLEGDSPVSNYTAELPDTLDFEGFTYPIFDNNNTIGGTDTTGPFPPWLAAGCQSLCISFLSADDAFACAARQAFICAHTPPTGPQPNFFFNTQQSCPFTCPDGTLFVFTVLPGYFVALSQAEADGLAQALACERAIADHVCMGNLTPEVCSGAAYNSTMQLFGLFPMGVSVVSGSLPPGMVLTQDPAGMTATVSGTCNTPGNYQFALMATDPLGNFHVKNYTIAVLGITNTASLGQPTVARPFSAQLVAAGGTAPYTFSVVDSLPLGLTVSPTGLISGTVSVHYLGKFTSTFQVTDANNFKCTGVWSSTTKEPPGPDWTTLVWTNFVLNQGTAANTVTGQGSGQNASASLVLNSNLANVSITPVQTNGVAYTGPQVNCEFQMIVTQWDPSAQFTFIPVHSVAGQLPVGGGPITGPGVWNLTFTVPASVAATISFNDGSPGNRFAFLPANMFFGTALKEAFTLQLFNV